MRYRTRIESMKREHVALSVDRSRNKRIPCVPVWTQTGYERDTRSVSTTSHGEHLMHVEGTVPYPWPWDGRLDPLCMALLVVGAQGWLVDRTRANKGALDKAALAARALKEAGGIVLVVRHVRPWAAAHPR